MTHISYEVSKKLKEFLGDSAPEPMDGSMSGYWAETLPGEEHHIGGQPAYPRYQLHDLLSKPFCEAMAKALSKTLDFNTWVYGNISEAYWYGGLPDVEKVLMEMMEGK